MEITIDNNNIRERVENCYTDLLNREAIKEDVYDHVKDCYDMIVNSEELVHNVIIEFCLFTNVSYEYIVSGKFPIMDVDNKNALYQRLISKGDYTIFI